MPRKIELEDVVVIVNVDTRWGKATVRDAENIKKDILRHVDNIGPVEIEEKYRQVCSFCGAKWTEYGPVYNGGCCDEDEKNNPNPLPIV